MPLRVGIALTDADDVNEVSAAAESTSASMISADVSDEIIIFFVLEDKPEKGLRRIPGITCEILGRSPKFFRSILRKFLSCKLVSSVIIHKKCQFVKQNRDFTSFERFTKNRKNTLSRVLPY